MPTDTTGPTSVNVRRISFALGSISMIMVVFLVAAPYWRVTARWGTAAVIANIYSFEGIFLSCVQTMGAAGTNQCLQIPSFGGMRTVSGYPNMAAYSQGVYSYLNAFRAFMIIALLASVSGAVCSALGMRCTTLLEEEGKGKRYVVIAGGLCHLLSGLLTGISVSWYAAEVVREYYSPYYQTQKMKYTLGACLYVGWISMVFSLVCGCLMVCCTCFNKPADETYEYGYKAPESTEKYHIPSSERAYREKSYHHQPDYYRSSGNYNSSKNYRSQKYERSHHSNRRSSYSSSDRSPKSSRYDSDVMRASGFV